MRIFGGLILGVGSLIIVATTIVIINQMQTLTNAETTGESTIIAYSDIEYEPINDITDQLSLAESAFTDDLFDIEPAAGLDMDDFITTEKDNISVSLPKSIHVIE